MNWIYACLCAVAFICSAISAALAWRGTKQPVVPTWLTWGNGHEPLDPTRSQAGWIDGMLKSNDAAGRLNRKAVAWAAGGAAISLASRLLATF